MTIELTAASIIVANILGYLLGNAGASLFSLAFGSQYLIHSLATAITTETLGWSILLFSKIYRKGKQDKDPRSASYLTWLILAMVVIFFLRLTFIFILSDNSSAAGDIAGMSLMVLSNSFSLILLICFNILFVWYSRRALKDKSSQFKFLTLTVFTLIVSLIEATLVFYGQSGIATIDTVREFVSLYLTAVIAQITIYCLVYMVHYAITAQNKVLKERGKANEAQYRYQILKRQVDWRR